MENPKTIVDLHTPPVVVCSAIKRDNIIILGARHFDPIMRDQLTRSNLDYKGWELGFIDQRGNFLTRKEAWIVADKQGQIRRSTGWEHNEYHPRPDGVGDDGLLFSENLY